MVFWPPCVLFLFQVSHYSVSPSQQSHTAFKIVIGRSHLSGIEASPHSRCLSDTDWSKCLISGTSLVVLWLGLHIPNARSPSSIPGRGTRSHMLQGKVWMPQLKILHACKGSAYSFLGGPVVKNPPTNAGDTGLISGRGNPTGLRATEPVATASEPTCGNYWSPCNQSLCSITREAAMRSPRMATKSSPCSLQLEKACIAMKTQHSPK